MKTTTSLRLKQILSERNLRQVDILNSSLPLQKELGIKMGKSALSQYVSGKSSPDQDKLVLLSKTLGVSEAWLMGYNVPMSDDTPVQELKIPTSPLVQKITEKAVQLSTPRKQKVLNYANEQLKKQNNKVIMIEEKLFEYRVFEKLAATPTKRSVALERLVLIFSIFSFCFVASALIALPSSVRASSTDLSSAIA